METPLEILREYADPVPEWLIDYKPGDPFPRDAVFSSRIVYYPGSATDGHPLRIFGKAHATHCFVYADYHTAATQVDEELQNELNHRHPKGYKVLNITHPLERELTPNGWRPHCNINMNNRQFGDMRPDKDPFARFAVLERLEKYGDDHGPNRLAYLHVGGDAYATFDALRCLKKNSDCPMQFYYRVL